MDGASAAVTGGGSVSAALFPAALSDALAAAAANAAAYSAAAALSAAGVSGATLWMLTLCEAQPLSAMASKPMTTGLTLQHRENARQACPACPTLAAAHRY